MFNPAFHCTVHYLQVSNILKAKTKKINGRKIGIAKKMFSIDLNIKIPFLFLLGGRLSLKIQRIDHKSIFVFLQNPPKIKQATFRAENQKIFEKILINNFSAMEAISLIEDIEKKRLTTDRYLLKHYEKVQKYF